MGINGLWDVIGDGEIVPVADYAARHFERYNRPLRIAVDEAGWRFNNLTDAVVAKIRQKEPAANPVEKPILWRILRLLKLNIQLLFVFDGPRRPWKRGRKGGGGKVWEKIELVTKMLDRLGVPQHRAPGEAEAECAKLQAMGVVDAVWSDDGDTLMFGATTQVEAHKVNGKRIEGYIRVYEMEKITRKYDLDAESLVLFALLAGGDYDTKGLNGCGPQTARTMAKRRNGLARALCRASKDLLPEWRIALQQEFDEQGKAIEVPFTFPDFKALGHYRKPTVSTPEQLNNLRGLQKGWDRSIDQTKLRVFLRERFAFQTREYMKHIAPVFMVRALTRLPTEGNRADNIRYDVKVKKVRRKKKDEGEDEDAANTEVKVTFYPLPAVEIDISHEPEGEDWSKFAGKDGSVYDPAQRVECELLSCVLRNGLGDEVFATEPPSPPKSRKRKTSGEGKDNSSQAGTPRKRVKKFTNPSSEPSSSAADTTDTVPAPKKRVRQSKDASIDPSSSQPKPTKKRSSSAKSAQKGVERPESLPPATFRQPREIPVALMKSLPRPEAGVVDLGSDSSIDVESEDEDLRRALVLSRAEIRRAGPLAVATSSPLFTSPATPRVAAKSSRVRMQPRPSEKDDLPIDVAESMPPLTLTYSDNQHPVKMAFPFCRDHNLDTSLAFKMSDSVTNQTGGRVEAKVEVSEVSVSTSGVDSSAAEASGCGRRMDRDWKAGGLSASPAEAGRVVRATASQPPDRHAGSAAGNNVKPTPGDTFASHTLRELRAASALLNQHGPGPDNETRFAQYLQRSLPEAKAAHNYEVIDLT